MKFLNIISKIAIVFAFIFIAISSSSDSKPGDPCWICEGSGDRECYRCGGDGIMVGNFGSIPCTLCVGGSHGTGKLGCENCCGTGKWDGCQNMSKERQTIEQYHLNEYYDKSSSKSSINSPSNGNKINNNQSGHVSKKVAFGEYEYKDLSKLGLDEIKRRLGELWKIQQSNGALYEGGSNDIEKLEKSYVICLEVINYMSERTLRGFPQRVLTADDLGGVLQSFTWSYQVNTAAREIEKAVRSKYSEIYTFQYSKKEINLKFWRKAISQITQDYDNYTNDQLFNWFIESGQY